MKWLWLLVPLVAADCPGYKASNVQKSKSKITADLSLAGSACNMYGTDFEHLKLLVEFQTDERLRVKIYDSEEKMFQIPATLLPEPSGSSHDSDFSFSLKEDPFSFTVTRKSNNETLFDTTGHNLVFESQYLRLTTSLSDSSNIYGLGESADPFLHDASNYSHTIWTAGEPFMPQNSNLYGAYPIYYDHRGSKGTHAVFLRNMNGQRINIVDHTLEYNLIGGVFDLYFLSGPTPKDASVQFADVIGKPTMMPYWGFGYHQCKFGYQDAYETAAVVANYSAANIPLETVWNDIDYMDYRATFTTDPIRFPLKRMRTLIDHLHAHDQHYIMMLDPAVAARDIKPYNDGKEMDVLMKENDGSVYTGVVWAGPSSFPDWFAHNVQEYWNKQFNSFFNADSGIDIDGLWIDMNEPSNFCDYPCKDPQKFATEARDPPRPPPARMYSPYKIPGFPDEFQPHCMATVTFNVKAEKKDGEDLLILGDALSIGDNTPRLAPPMKEHDGTFSLTVQLPADSEIEYSYPRYTHEGDYVYEAKNRTVKTGKCGYTATVSDTSPYPANGKSKKTRHEARKANDDPLNRELISPPYDIKNFFGQLSGQTMPTNLYHANGMVEYDVHSFYGSQMGVKSREALIQRRPGKRPLIITRSSIAGDGARVGHWFGDNRSTDDDYRLSINQMLQFPALFQMPMVGSDVCGFNYDTNPTLCARWAVLGSWNPFFRNHAEISAIYQEFYRWEVVANAARKAIATRYRLLDYTYSNMHRQSKTGVPMMSPLVWQYPEDKATYGIELQFFAGDALLVSPVTEPNSTSVEYYLPKGRFYNFWTHERVDGKGAMVKQGNIGYDEIPVHIRGGSIIPLRVKGAYTTTALRKEDFELVIAPDEHGRASGFLYLDDGESIEPSQTSEITFTYNNGALTGNGSFGYNPHVKLAKITILGCRGKETVKHVKFGLNGPLAFAITC